MKFNRHCDSLWLSDDNCQTWTQHHTTLQCGNDKKCVASSVNAVNGASRTASSNDSNGNLSKVTLMSPPMSPQPPMMGPMCSAVHCHCTGNIFLTVWEPERQAVWADWVWELYFVQSAHYSALHNSIMCFFSDSPIIHICNISYIWYYISGIQWYYDSGNITYL